MKPGESYTTDLVFDVPSEVTNPRLYITIADALPAPLLIGHERSPLHKKILFGLAPPARVQTQR